MVRASHTYAELGDDNGRNNGKYLSLGPMCHVDYISSHILAGSTSFPPGVIRERLWRAKYKLTLTLTCPSHPVLATLQ